MEKKLQNVHNFEIGDFNPSNGLLIGNRIPRDFFITTGYGESDISVHAGSYHLALKNAGIEKANIVTYSSVLPSIANQIDIPDEIILGSVMETIMAVANGKKNELISAGIKFGWLYHRVTGEKFGGLVCEYSGNCDENELEKVLSASLLELYENGFEDEYELKEEKLIKNSFIPQKLFGTVIVSLCFMNYLYPIILKTDG
ncbi:MAG: pyruvoyl-dependent arginine decarboxylase [Candidatus Aminicenantes bacterium]|nr:pyruvoyl-dependent arginine decarboxylase [Candidatus Aminicenantes bacterium]